MENIKRINNPIPGNKVITEDALLDLWMKMYITPQYGSFGKKTHINQNVRDFVREVVKIYGSRI